MSFAGNVLAMEWMPHGSGSMTKEQCLALAKPTCRSSKSDNNKHIVMGVAAAGAVASFAMVTPQAKAQSKQSRPASLSVTRFPKPDVKNVDWAKFFSTMRAI